MIGDGALEGSGHSNGLELGGVHFILVEIEEVCDGEVWLNACINMPIGNLLGEESQPFVDDGVVLVGRVDEDVKGVHKEAVCFAPVLLVDGCDDVPREITVRSGWTG